jgi:hypothetical protein
MFKLYVGNLAYSVSNDDPQQLFSQAGQVQSVTLITDKFSAQSKGFGFGVAAASVRKCTVAGFTQCHPSA